MVNFRPSAAKLAAGGGFVAKSVARANILYSVRSFQRAAAGRFVNVHDDVKI